MEESVRDLLASTAFGAGLSSHALDRLASIARRLELPAGAELFAEGEPTPFLALLLGGRVALVTHVAGRGDEVVLTVNAGDVVGWTAVAAPNRAVASVVTLVPCDFAVLDAEVLRALVDEDPTFGVELYRRVLESLGRRLSAARTQLLDLYRAEP